MEILSKLINYTGDGQQYYLVTNDQKKQWLLNNDHMRLGLELYQPTSIKGKLFKLFFPYIKEYKFARNILNFEEVKLLVNKNIYDVLKTIYGQEFTISVFGGTPCVHQKAIIQICKGEEIKSYCKVTDNVDIAALFDKECEVLHYLNSCGIEQIPMVIKRASVGDFEIFIQSNVKDFKSKSSKKLDKISFEFLNELYCKTRCELLFENTDYANMLDELKQNCRMLNRNQQNIISNVIKKIESRYTGKMVFFCYYHGDFTPWNTSIKNNKLVAFDFEYSKKSYPPFLDAYHFYLQTEIFGKHSKITSILNKIKDISNEIFNYDIDNTFHFEMYLLEVINLYLSRNNRGLDEIENLSFRLKILKLFQSDNA